ncbi:MAG TPA: hypothetical protein VFQ45_08980 [Longimicrobium sp.]|nr:hypothetical protein [Longimicrobium sp.]
MPRIRTLLVAPALLLSGACIPYTTGTTATPVAEGTLVPNSAIYFVPGGMENFNGDSAGASIIGMDVEIRYGIDARSDIGVRFPGFSGVVLNYKRRVDGGPAEGPAVALLLGTGVVNAGEHFELEASLLASGRPNEDITPYGGLKTIVVIPAIAEAVRDEPSVGVFAGLRLGTERLGMSPEVAVFYDPSALGLRDGNWIVVPSVTFHGRELFDLLLGRGTPMRTPRPPGPRVPPYPARQAVPPDPP